MCVFRSQPPAYFGFNPPLCTLWNGDSNESDVRRSLRPHYLLPLHLQNHPILFISHTNELVTDSFHVAKYFGKQHKNELQKLQNLECSKSFTKLNFQLCDKNNELQNNKIQPFYQMTKVVDV